MQCAALSARLRHEREDDVDLGLRVLALALVVLEPPAGQRQQLAERLGVVRIRHLHVALVQQPAAAREEAARAREAAGRAGVSVSAGARLFTRMRRSAGARKIERAAARVRTIGRAPHIWLVSMPAM